MPNFDFQFPYELRVVEETIAGAPFRFQCLKSLDQTIDLLFEELQRRNDPTALEKLCPYFGVIWPAGRGLAEAMAQAGARGELKGQRVLEIGCGLALPSLIAAKFGAQVVATDMHPDVPAFLQRNCELNSIGDGLEYRALDWHVLDLGEEKFDWVIGSDILYERQHTELVAETLKRAARPGGHIVVGDPGRPYLQEFEFAMRKRGFKSSMEIFKTVEELSRKPGQESGAIVPKDVFVLRFNDASRT